MTKVNNIESIDSRHMLTELMDMNEYTQDFGLSISAEDAALLLTERRDILRDQERVEFKGELLPKLISEFHDSQYVYQENYIETIVRLQEIFYLCKNESLDRVSDDELIEYMKESFNGRCGGSLDNLEDIMEEFAANAGNGGYGFEI